MPTSRVVLKLKESKELNTHEEKLAAALASLSQKKMPNNIQPQPVITDPVIERYFPIGFEKDIKRILAKRIRNKLFEEDRPLTHLEIDEVKDFFFRERQHTQHFIHNAPINVFKNPAFYS